MEGRDARAILQYIQQERPPVRPWRDAGDRSPEFARLMEEVERIQATHYQSSLGTHTSAKGLYQRAQETAMMGAKRTLRFSTESVQNESYNRPDPTPIRHSIEPTPSTTSTSRTAAPVARAMTSPPPPRPPQSALRTYEQMFTASRTAVSHVASAVRRQFRDHSPPPSSTTMSDRPLFRAQSPPPASRNPINFDHTDRSSMRSPPPPALSTEGHHLALLRRFGINPSESAGSSAGVRGRLRFDDTRGTIAGEDEEGFRDAHGDEFDSDDGSVIGDVREEDFHEASNYYEDEEEELDAEEEPEYEEEEEDGVRSLTYGQQPSNADDDMDASERLARELMEAEQAELLERLHAEQQRALAQLRAAGGEAQQWLNLSEEQEEADGGEESAMDYDQLLELGERLGDVRTERWRQRSAEVAAGLPMMKFADVKRRAPMYRDDLCVICQFNFEDDEEVKLMPNCTHSFHADCADQWVKDHDRCATCKAAIESQRD